MIQGRMGEAGRAGENAIGPAYPRLMARYNRWQNRNLIDAANTLDDAARRADLGAFFGSIHATFCHLLWADRIWLHRFAGLPKPEGGIADSPALVADWDDFRVQRAAFDETIFAWAETLDPAWLAGELSWFSASMNRDMTQPVSDLVIHLFNHQTHHRGQIHAMLTAAGARPGVTDLAMMP